MISELHALAWSRAQAGEAIEGLARRSSLLGPGTPGTLAEGSPPTDIPLASWIAYFAQRLGLESEAVETPYIEVEALLRGAGPALLRLPGDGMFLALLRATATRVALLTPQGEIRWVPLALVRAALCEPIEAPLRPEIDRVLAQAQVPPAQRERARQRILAEQLRGARVLGGWLLRLAPGASFWQHLARAGVWRNFALFVGMYAVRHSLWILSWWVIGGSILAGRLDWGWAIAWVLLLLTQVPAQMVVTWQLTQITAKVSRLLKQRLLHGAMQLQPDAIRHQGTGQLLGRVLESEAVETLALSGGFLGVVALFELAVAAWVLAAGAAAGSHLLLLALWVLLTALIAWRHWQQRHAWTDARLSLTHDLVERMSGHRTRLAQEPREQWHESEDQSLATYLALSERMDRTNLLMQTLIPHGWLLAGLAALTPAFVAGQSSAPLAVSIGGLLLAHLALRKVGQSLTSLNGAAIAWQSIAPLMAAARQEVAVPPALLPRPPAAERGDTPLLEGHRLTFRYRERSAPILQQCEITIRAGERFLLEGPSGGGKSTLAALLTGLRLPESGLLLLQGLDHRTLGHEGWRRRVVTAPQFHENHVFAETFAFNLLMGRDWPATQAELAEARALCQELGLGELLEQMPAGIMQLVGERGWQLSHGERSRLYIARALLQGADLIILDESFAALDPENLERTLHCVLRRAPALLVIAHP